MKDSYHVVFNKGGITKLQKTLPKSLGPGEFALQVNLEVPDEVFATPTVPVTTITVDPTQVTRRLPTIAETTAVKV